MQFHLTGWSGNGNTFGAPPSTLTKFCDATADGDPYVPSATDKNKPCIRGYFVKYTTEAGGAGPGACNTSTVLLACRVYLFS